jgi:hypothetical protein
MSEKIMDYLILQSKHSKTKCQDKSLAHACLQMEREKSR